MGISGEGTFRTFLQALLAWVILTGATEVLAARRNWETPWRKLLYSGTTSLLFGVVLAGFVISETYEPNVIVPIVGFYFAVSGALYVAIATGLHSGISSSGSASNNLEDEIRDMIVRYEYEFKEYERRVNRISKNDENKEKAEEDIHDALALLEIEKERVIEGSVLSTIRHYYFASEKKIYVLFYFGKTESTDEHEALTKRILRFSQKWINETRYKEATGNLILEGKLQNSTKPDDVNDLWRDIYTENLQWVNILLLLRSIFRGLSMALLLALIVYLAAIPLLEFKPVYYLVPVFGIIGSAVNNARTLSAPEVTLQINEQRGANLQAPVTVPLIAVRLLVGATVAIFVVLLIKAKLIGSVETPPEELLLAAAFVGGFSDELVAKGVEELVKKIMGSEETPEPITGTTGADGDDGGGSGDGDTKTANANAGGENQELEDADDEAESRESGTSDAEGTDQERSQDGESGAGRTNRETERHDDIGN